MASHKSSGHRTSHLATPSPSPSPSIHLYPSSSPSPALSLSIATGLIYNGVSFTAAQPWRHPCWIFSSPVEASGEEGGGPGGDYILAPFQSIPVLLPRHCPTHVYFDTQLLLGTAEGQPQHFSVLDLSHVTLTCYVLQGCSAARGPPRKRVAFTSSRKQSTTRRGEEFAKFVFRSSSPTSHERDMKRSYPSGAEKKKQGNEKEEKGKNDSDVIWKSAVGMSDMMAREEEKRATEKEG
ncbi:hypothetical protein INR49_013779 [Caranx melampygus]|nr:hypothetical protein INR49_013779 [Caranx melampygus]